jgi:hypothetical protein
MLGQQRMAGFEPPINLLHLAAVTHFSISCCHDSGQRS